MLIRADGLVVLSGGETLPIRCERCSRVYQPDSPLAVGSRCRACGNANWHDDQEWRCRQGDIWEQFTSMYDLGLYDIPDESPND